jgi:hypothetical protein
MSLLAWTETLDGWIGGRYQIELAAPRLWVLSRRNADATGPELVPVTVVKTAGSLKELKRLADQLEAKRHSRRRLRIHLSVLLALLTTTIVGGALGMVFAIPALAGTFVAALRTVVVWIDHVTGSAWKLVSENYQ